MHDRVREEMLAIYQSDEIPSFLDAGARGLLAEGRDNFARFGLREERLLAWSEGTLLFGWCGDRVMDTLVVWMSFLGHKVAQEGVTLVFPGRTPDLLRAECTRLAALPPPDPIELAEHILNKKTEKFHPWLSERLLTLDAASRAMDVPGAWELVRSVAGAQAPT